MNAERWQRVEELYHAALERTPEERAAFLKEACPDADLRREVESLVGSDPPANSVLDQPAWERRLAAGERLGPYETLEQIGAGGMGEVWKARDTRLGRTVAIKVCAERFSARFEREARAIAALNHTHICTLYDVGPNYLVMEYVEGQPLKGPLPLEKAVEYGRQILDGLEAAHRKGIVHRDLKPANVLVTKAGIKLLDFGLAKVQPGTAAAQVEIGTIGPTGEQLIAGTPQYMAPEQIEGMPVDVRTDIFAFGCVLHELLTGQRAFAGNSPSSTMAAVLASEPAPVSKLQPTTPGEIDRIVDDCLAKNPEQRFQSARDVRRALDWAVETRNSPRHEKSVVPWAAAAAFTILAIVAIAAWWRGTRSVDRPLVRLSADLGPDALLGANTTVAISPDGRRLIFPARGPDGKQRLATRLLDQTQTTLLPGTEEGFDPFFSPDGQWVGFFADRKLKKLLIQGGAPVTVASTGAQPWGGSWGDDGSFVFTPAAGSPLSRVPASAGKHGALTKLVDGEVTHRWPQVLPGGEAVLFTASRTNFGHDDASIQVMVFKTGMRKTVQRGGYSGRYLPSGHLVYVRQGILFGVGFDPERLEVRGTPTPLLEDLAGNSTQGGGQFDFSRAPYGPGTLVYLEGRGAKQELPLVMVDRSGKTQTLLATPGVYAQPRFSPDGKRLAVMVSSKGNDIFVYDRQRDTMTQLTFDGHSTAPVWSPDGMHIAFHSTADGSAIFWVRQDGADAPQLLLKSSNVVRPMSFSPDGRRLAYFKTNHASEGDNLWTLPLDLTDRDHPKPGKPEPFLQTPPRTDHQLPFFSPDGRWIAYKFSSSESGSQELYVSPFPGPGGKWRISAGAVGAAALGVFWSQTRRELFYVSSPPDRRIMVVDYAVNGDSFIPGKPRLWSDRLIIGPGLDLAPDGKHFAVFDKPEAAGPDKGSVHVTFLLNFFDELRRRVPSGAR